MERVIEYIIGMTFLTILVVRDISNRKAKQIEPTQKKKPIHTKRKKNPNIVQFNKKDHIQAMWDEMRKDGY